MTEVYDEDGKARSHPYKLHENQDLPWHLADAPVIKTYQWIAAWARSAVQLQEEIAKATEAGVSAEELEALQAQVVPTLVSMIAPMGGSIAPEQFYQDMSDALDICERKSLAHAIESGEFDINALLADVFGAVQGPPDPENG